MSFPLFRPDPARKEGPEQVNRLLFRARAVFFAAIAAFLLASLGSGTASPAERNPGFAVSLSTLHPAQGDPVLVEVCADPAADNVTLAWKGRIFPLEETAPGRYLGIVGVDLADPPGKEPLSVAVYRDGLAGRFDMDLLVREREFPVQRLTLPKKMAVFDKTTLARIRRESKRLRALFSVVSPPSWNLPFAPPVKEYNPTDFGAKRFINGEPRSRHAGVDIHVPAGTPVVAMAAGTVAFAGEQFFGGRSVVLDHGGGIFTVYYHLQEYSVRTGQHVNEGETIGAVGSTGRATGPHLHFGVRAAGGRIDPSLLFGPTFR